MPSILSVNNYFYRRGGAETVFLEHNQILNELGWTVVPFSMHSARNLTTPWSEFFIDEIEFGAQYSFREKLLRAPKVVYSFEARKKLSQLLEHVHPNICHAHNIYHHISPSILGLLRKRGIPTVLTLHDLKVACPDYQMLTHDGICERCRGGRLYNVVLHRCIKNSAALSTLVFVEAVVHRLIGSYQRYVDRFVVPSQFYIKKLSEWGVPATMCRHVPNFVDSSHFAPEYAPGSAFVYFGRLAREKGLHTLVRAAATAQCRVDIIGSGPELESLHRLADKENADVRFLGYLTGAPLHQAIRTARAVVLPSEWYENAPMSVLEAYALGKPVIGARIGGIPELVRDGATGFQFTSGDVLDLARKLHLTKEASDSDIAAMGRNGREWVERDFTATVYRDRILGVYRELGVTTTAMPISCRSI
jgi:glycosyltransferase involved in cell wall biosynthesis